MSILTTFKNLLSESLTENKKLIIGLYAAFIIVFVASWIFSMNRISEALPTLQNMSSTAVNTTAFSDLGPVELFMNNGVGGFYTYIASVFFAIPSIVMVFYNAVNLAVLGPLFNSVLPNGGLYYIIYLIPHGIFEITGTIIQASAGILLFVFIVKFIRACISKESNGISDAFDKTKKVLIQSLVLMVFATILMLIAAPIEAYFSLPFADFVMGLL